MKTLLIFFLSFFPPSLKAQHISEAQQKQILLNKFQKSDSLKKLIDAETLAIDQMSYWKIETDSIAIADISNPFKVLGFIIENKFWASEGKLIKAKMTDYSGKTQISYIRDTLVIKGLIIDVKKSIKKEFYYTKEDNTLNLFLLYRISKMLPEMEEYFNVLSFGKSYLR